MSQLTQVAELLSDGEPHSLVEIRQIGASADARVRDLRKLGIRVVCCNRRSAAETTYQITRAADRRRLWG